ncbi:hypothetical protein SFUMM280S_08172 [Streptomyces fumanus]
MPNTDEGLDGLRVLVTGGSRGLGAATARRFVAAGATVLTASRSRPAEDGGATFVPADLSTAQGVAELGRRVVDQVGGVDVLVNNAGAASAPAPTLSRSDASWQADLEMNLLSAVRLDRAAGHGRAGLRRRRTRLLDRQPTAPAHRGVLTPPPRPRSTPTAAALERLRPIWRGPCAHRWRLTLARTVYEDPAATRPSWPTPTASPRRSGIAGAPAGRVRTDGVRGAGHGLASAGGPPLARPSRPRRDRLHRAVWPGGSWPP